MNIFVYSDESGVFDKKHSLCFVYGGVIFLSKEDKDSFSRYFFNAEKNCKIKKEISSNKEYKACIMSRSDKHQLFKATNRAYRFGVIMNLQNLDDKFFSEKVIKQKTINVAYRKAIRSALINLINAKKIDPSLVENIYFFCDEHTAPIGMYDDFETNLFLDFKRGILDYDSFKVVSKEVFPNLKNLMVKQRDSSKNTLIRAADIIANTYLNYGLHKIELSDEALVNVIRL